MAVDNPEIDVTAVPADSRFTLPPPVRHSEDMFPTTTYFGRDLRLFSVAGKAADGTVIRFANICASLTAWNYHYSELNGWALAELSMWTTRTTTGAHKNRGDILTNALAMWLSLDWLGQQFFKRNSDGSLTYLAGTSGSLPFFTDSRYASLELTGYQQAMGRDPE